MKEKKVTKLWQGKYVSVRDYEVRDAIKKGGLRIMHDNQVMDVMPDELKLLTPTSKVFQSKYKGTYRLIDITFCPLTVDPNQHTLNLGEKT
jgi:hypothetical protein